MAVNFVKKREIAKDQTNRNLINSFFRSQIENAQTMYHRDLFAHYGCVNAIEFTSDGKWLLSGGDDRRVLLWNVTEALTGSPNVKVMKGQHNSNIFCLGLDAVKTNVYSAGNDEQVIIQDYSSGNLLDVFIHDEAVYGISVDPQNTGIFVSACDNGCILVWDLRLPRTSDPCILARSASAFHAVTHNPMEPKLIATANTKEGVALWDIRKPRSPLIKYGSCLASESSMSVRFNSRGTHLMSLRRRLAPVLYEISSVVPAVEFDHPGYYNSCTMKSSCFAGDDDQYILSGSDDFNLYFWKIPCLKDNKKGLWVNRAHLVLEGHRSLVNQVRYNRETNILASSGVEKIIKLWSHFPVSDRSHGLDAKTQLLKDSLRKVYSYEEYINLVLESGQLVTHDYTHQSVEEDPRMMAFFDSLVQRDIEGWTTETSDSSSSEEALNSSIDVHSDHSSSTSVSDRSFSPSLLFPFRFPTLRVSSSDSSSSEEDLENSVSRCREEALTPQMMEYIGTITRRFESSFQSITDSSSLQSESKRIPDTTPCLDNPVSECLTSRTNRITELIAHKRKEHLLRTTRSMLKVTRKKLLQAKRSPKGDNSPHVDSQKKLAEEVRTLLCTQKLVDSLKGEEKDEKDKKDQRRKLRTRRAKLLKGISDSSDSEEETMKVKVMGNLETPSVVRLEKMSTLELSSTRGEASSGSSVGDSGKGSLNSSITEGEAEGAGPSTSLTTETIPPSEKFNELKRKPSQRQYRKKEKD